MATIRTSSRTGDLPGDAAWRGVSHSPPETALAAKRREWAAFALLAAAYLVLNGRASKGYFQDDDLDTMTWAPYVRSPDFLRPLISFRLSPSNFRPVGAYYYHVLSLRFPLDFPKFVVPLQLAQLLNALLLCKVTRRLGSGAPATFAGVSFYLFHPALLDAAWKPMYIFDVLCTSFCLLSFLLWLHDRAAMSFVAFCLAYRAKELAVMLPAVLMSYEFLLGRKRWKPLLPFLLVSLSFGLQGILANQNRDGDYALRFHLSALAATSFFYASTLFLVPFGGFALAPVALLVRDRRLWFGLASTLLFFVPLQFLPGRLFAVYWCLPLTGIAMALAAAMRDYGKTVAVLLILWVPWSFVHLRCAQKENLRLERGNRAFVSGVAECARIAPSQTMFVYDGVPQGFHSWGAIGAIGCVYRKRGLHVLWIDDPGARDLVQTGGAVLLHWDSAVQQLRVVRMTRPLGEAPGS